MEDQYYIQELIENKRFEDLSSDEQKLVLQHITEKEYRNRRELIQHSSAFLNQSVEGLAMDSTVLDRAKILMEHQKSKSSLVLYRIPAWQALAACLIIAFIMFYTRDSKTQVIAKTPIKQEPKIVYVKDTVVVNKEVPTIQYVDKIRYKEIVKEVPAKVPDGLGDLPVNLALTGKELNALSNVSLAKERFQEQLKNIGQSSGDMENLKQFLVVSN